MICIQHHFHVRSTDFSDKLDTLIACIDQITFVPVDHFHAERNTAGLSQRRQSLHSFYCPFPLFFLRTHCMKIHRPVIIQCTTEYMHVQLCHFIKTAFIPLKRAFPNFLIAGSNIMDRSGSIPPCQLDSFIFRTLAKFPDSSIGIVRQGAASDLKRIETKTRNLLDIIPVIRVPFLLPISIIYSILQLHRTRLRFISRADCRSSSFRIRPIALAVSPG